MPFLVRILKGYFQVAMIETMISSSHLPFVPHRLELAMNIEEGNNAKRIGTKENHVHPERNETVNQRK